MCLWICEYVDKFVYVYLDNIGRKVRYFCSKSWQYRQVISYNSDCPLNRLPFVSWLLAPLPEVDLQMHAEFLHLNLNGYTAFQPPVRIYNQAINLMTLWYICYFSNKAAKLLLTVAAFSYASPVNTAGPGVNKVSEADEGRLDGKGYNVSIKVVFLGLTLP